MKWEFAPDIQKQIEFLVQKLSFPYLKSRRIFCFRSYGSKSAALARIWSLPRIWQKALKAEPAYCLEVLAERFDKMSREDKTRTLIHELLHIPQNFSGTLLPHRKKRGERFEKRVERMFNEIR